MVRRAAGVVATVDAGAVPGERAGATDRGCIAVCAQTSGWHVGRILTVCGSTNGVHGGHAATWAATVPAALVAGVGAVARGGEAGVVGTGAASVNGGHQRGRAGRARDIPALRPTQTAAVGRAGDVVSTVNATTRPCVRAGAANSARVASIAERRRWRGVGAQSVRSTADGVHRRDAGSGASPHPGSLVAGVGASAGCWELGVVCGCAKSVVSGRQFHATDRARNRPRLCPTITFVVG